AAQLQLFRHAEQTLLHITAYEDYQRGIVVRQRFVGQNRPGAILGLSQPVGKTLRVYLESAKPDGGVRGCKIIRVSGIAPCGALPKMKTSHRIGRLRVRGSRSPVWQAKRAVHPATEPEAAM